MECHIGLRVARFAGDVMRKVNLRVKECKKEYRDNKKKMKAGEAVDENGDMAAGEEGMNKKKGKAKKRSSKSASAKSRGKGSSDDKMQNDKKNGGGRKRKRRGGSEEEGSDEENESEPVNLSSLRAFAQYMEAAAGLGGGYVW